MKLNKNKFLYYGSFNPITLGHKHVIDMVFKKFGKDIYIFVEAVNELYYPPKKDILIPIAQRHNMMFDTICGYQNVVVGVASLLEARHVKWYDLAQKHDARNIIIGSDNLKTIEKYYSTKGEYIQDMLENCNIIVVNRDGFDSKEYVKNSEKLSGYRNRFTFLKPEKEFCSSSQVREKIKNNKNFSQDVHEEVYKYVNKYNFYKGSNSEVNVN